MVAIALDTEVTFCGVDDWWGHRNREKSKTHVFYKGKPTKRLKGNILRIEKEKKTGKYAPLTFWPSFLYTTHMFSISLDFCAPKIDSKK